MNDTAELTAVGAARIVGGPDRVETIPLTYPIEFNGRTWTEITLKRLTALDLKAHFNTPADQRVNDTPWFDAPREVLAALDLDDEDRVMERADRFIPARFRVAPASGQGSPDGDSSSPASPTA